MTSQLDADKPVPNWPAYLPTARAEASQAVTYWPTPKAEAAELGGSGPRPDQHHRGDRSMSTATTTTWAPTRDDLDALTARTAQVMADRSATPADRQRAAEREERAHQAYLQRPGADAEMQAAAEKEWEAGA